MKYISRDDFAYLIAAKVSLESNMELVPLGEELGERLVLTALDGVLQCVFKCGEALGGALEDRAKEVRVEFAQMVRMDHQASADDSGEVRFLPIATTVRVELLEAVLTVFPVWVVRRGPFAIEEICEITLHCDSCIVHFGFESQMDSNGKFKTGAKR